jgi:NAD(P)-dependent dehydrogenase (short-subunit alcohol dehydrogenase family)
MLLDGRKIVVTGASGALGEAIVAAIVAHGGTVTGLVHRAGRPGDIPVDDLADFNLTAPAMKLAAERMGGLDGLVNVAGGFDMGKVADSELELWDGLYAKNLRSAVSASKAALAHLGMGGAIVNIAAAAGLKAEAGMGAYAASKAGVLRLTEALAAEQRKAGIRANAILPTIMDTPANRTDMPKADRSTWVSTAAVAELAVFLLSDASRAVSGAGIIAGS